MCTHMSMLACACYHLPQLQSDTAEKILLTWWLPFLCYMCIRLFIFSSRSVCDVECIMYRCVFFHPCPKDPRENRPRFSPLIVASCFPLSLKHLPCWKQGSPGRWNIPTDVAILANLIEKSSKLWLPICDILIITNGWLEHGFCKVGWINF